MSYLKERLKHAVRFRHKRGYGVHSPFMFYFILNVLRDKGKQFTYPETGIKMNFPGRRERKVFRLLSRLIRYFRVHRVVCIGRNAEMLVDYLKHTNPEVYMKSNVLEELPVADFICLGRKTSEILPVEFSFGEMLSNKPKYMVIADIYKDSFNGRLWRQYRDKATVSVDMMWYGLLLFDEKIQPGKYNSMI